MKQSVVRFFRAKDPLDGFTVSDVDFESLRRIARKGIRVLPNVGKSLKFQTFRLLTDKDAEKDLYQDALGNVARR